MDPHAVNTLPLKDHGSFVGSHTCSDADILDHRSQDTVYIGLQFPRQRHHRKHHKHQRKDHDDKADGAGKPLFNDPAPPSQRVQYLLGDEDDEEHKPHEMFCEMDELHVDGNEMEWKESARWIKFEEDVEEGGERWSKPHVATLSLHSLFELRCCLMNGTILLDMDAVTVGAVADLVLDQMLAHKQLEEELREKVRDTLLTRHRHQNEKRHRGENGSSKLHLPLIRSLADIGKKYSETKLAEDRLGAKSTPNFSSLVHNASSPMLTANNSLPSTGSFSNHADLPENTTSHKLNLHFMKKIPQGAEASNILVGEVDFLTHPISAFVRLARAIQLGDLTEVPVPTRFLFIMLGPVVGNNKYHEIGRSIATLLSDEVFHDVAYKAKSRQDLLAGIDEFLDQVTVLPPGEWDPSIRIEPPKSIPSQESRKLPSAGHLAGGTKAMDKEEEEEVEDPSLIRTGRIFGGLIMDVRKKVPFYRSDFSDALHIQSVASFIFLYFACLTPIITFGGLLGDATDQDMAALESILAGAICGITYALCAGQPLTILGSTGPVLVFETILSSFCSDNGLNYLSFRVWIGLWTGIILIVIVAFDLSALVRYITRFTEESFAALISLIFIVEAFEKVVHITKRNPINLHYYTVIPENCSCGPDLWDHGHEVSENRSIELWASRNWSALDRPGCNDILGIWDGSPGCKYMPDVFLLSFVTFLATFTIALGLKLIRNSRCFPTMVRSVLSDFAILIAILFMVGLDAIIGLDTPKLNVPQKFAPTSPDRGWFIDPIGKNPWWTTIAAILPALLATILIFMDQQITAVIVNRKENKLVKGHGYHLDLFIVAVLIVVCSFLGLPWFVAATVLSITHVVSLKKESSCTAPGESVKFLGVREQRVTGTLVFLVIGLSVLLTSVLRYIPMSVLYGVFLYMGVSSLRGMQLVDRFFLMFMPPKYQPDYTYLRHVRVNRVHLFTFIQILCLVVLWVIKSVKIISIAFPIMVLAMCFVRKGMDRIFTQRELKWLDDIMPESHKRAKEDEAQKEMQDVPRMIEGGTVQVPLNSGNVINIPVERITISTQDSVNISEEMSKTGIWKTIMANDSQTNLPSMEKSAKRSKPKKLKSNMKSDPKSVKLPMIPGSPEEQESPSKSGKKKNSAPVRFYIDEEPDENEHLIKMPEIVIEPPSEVQSPEKDDSNV